MSCQLIDAEHAPANVRALDPSALWFLTWKPGSMTGVHNPVDETRVRMRGMGINFMDHPELVDGRRVAIGTRMDDLLRSLV